MESAIVMEGHRLVFPVYGANCNGQVIPATVESCNGSDDDCDTQVDENLGVTSCGLGLCQHTSNNCVNGTTQVCNPMQGASTTENCILSGDNDCDGLSDATDGDCLPQNYYCDNDMDNHWTTAPPVTCIGTGCVPSSCNAYRVAVGDDCNDVSAPDVYYRAQSEYGMGGGYCSDVIDNNCHNGVNDGCPVPEICNDNADNDLDGLVDGADTADCDACYSLDNDGDGYYQNVVSVYVAKTVNCPSGTKTPGLFDCGDSAATIHPGAPELCDGLDNDCNGTTTDDGIGVTAQNNANQQGVCAGSKQVCAGGVWKDDYSSVSNYLLFETKCADSMDNNCNGLIDVNDPDCACNCNGKVDGAENCLNCSDSISYGTAACGGKNGDVFSCGATAGVCGVYFSSYSVGVAGPWRSQPYAGMNGTFLGAGSYKFADMPFFAVVGRAINGIAVDRGTTVNFFTNDNFTGMGLNISTTTIVNNCNFNVDFVSPNWGCNFPIRQQSVSDMII